MRLPAVIILTMVRPKPLPPKANARRSSDTALHARLLLFDRHGETSIVQPAFARGSTALFRGAVGGRKFQRPQLRHAEQQMSDRVVSEPGKMHDGLTVGGPPASLLGSGPLGEFGDLRSHHYRFPNDALAISTHPRKGGQSGAA